MIRIFFSLILFLAHGTICYSQFPETHSSSEIYHELLKAGNTASILYIAAHPDDENTRLISYFENELHARTAYLSLTRGDGGQNLIGTEIGSSIGVLRTQELLSAREIDGGEQFFTRAVDFGYSKSADETFEKWGKDKILRDVVYVVRKFRPDVIVTRFPTANYGGHGHHHASAILAQEAFELANDKTAFPDQLEFVEPWQPKRLYFNASTWWMKDLEEKAKGSEDYLMINVGEFNPVLGETYAQIAARSRSEHKSQGFGSDYPYGNQIEFLEFQLGEKAKTSEGILSGVSTGWGETEVPQVGRILNEAIANFDFSNPSQSIPLIIGALKLLENASTSPLVERKITELQDLLMLCAGIETEAYTDQKFVVPGKSFSATVVMNDKTGSAVHLKSISGLGVNKIVDSPLKKNDLFSEEVSISVPVDADFSNPYWLREPYKTVYAVNGYDNLGKPENDPSVILNLKMSVSGYEFEKSLPVQYKVVDPAKAVLYSPVYVVPEITFNFSEDVVVSVGEEARTISLAVTAHAPDVKGKLKLILPDGWTSAPKEYTVNLEKAESTKLFSFTLNPSKKAQKGTATVSFSNVVDQASPTAMSLRLIDYEHIPLQIELKPAEIEIVPVDLNRGIAETIGYIEGPGDDVNKYLKAAGYKVREITEEELISGDFSRYDAIITGIRAYNTREDLSFANNALSNYVKNGGTWLVQYNTSRGLKADTIGPYPFQITRERVTDEDAVARFLEPQHPVMTQPNKIEMTDFENWVQERGLYFAADWSAEFRPILSWSDAGEPARDGGLIIAPHGKGYFVYSGISFFRQLPAGVPGAYRLLANILALGKDTQETND